MVSEDHLSLLESLGLTRNEASVYLSLLDKTESLSISEVAEGCGLPEPDANSTLIALLDKGFVKMDRNNVTAVPPEVSLFAALEAMEKDMTNRFETAREAVTTLQKPLQGMYWENRVGIRPEELLEALDDLKAMERRTAKMISEAKESILIFAETFGWYGSVRKQLVSSLKTGVKVRLLVMTVDEGIIARTRELEQMGVEVRQYPGEWYPVRGTLVDDKELVFLIWATRKNIERPISFRPHYTRNPGLIRAFADSFQKRWGEGRPLVLRE